MYSKLGYVISVDVLSASSNQTVNMEYYDNLGSVREFIKSIYGKRKAIEKINVSFELCETRSKIVIKHIVIYVNHAWDKVGFSQKRYRKQDITRDNVDELLELLEAKHTQDLDSIKYIVGRDFNDFLGNILKESDVYRVKQLLSLND